jgi:peptide/nickel transport system permease protein
MSTYVVRRVGEGVIVLWLLVTAVFFAIRLLPGGPAVLLINPEFLTADAIAQVEESLGLDSSLPHQYAAYIRSVATADLGYSYSKNAPVSELIADRFLPTLVLASSTLLFSVLVGTLLGVVIAWRERHLLGRALRPLPIVAVTTPSFWFGLILIYLFAIQLDILPSGGMAPPGEPWNPFIVAKHLILPTVTLSLSWIGNFALYTSSSLSAVLKADYVRTAKAKGLGTGVVLLRHALPNASIPLITQVGLSIPHLFAGSVVVEQIFGWPGIGRLTIESLQSHDYPVILGIVLLTGIIVVLTNLFVDFMYRAINPQIRL